MRDIQISRPVLIALVGAILVGGFLFFKSNSNNEVAVAPPTSVQTAATGATGGSTGGTGGTGASGPTMSASEIRAQKKKEARAKLVAAAEEKGIPLNVFEPLQDGKTVMILFWTKKGQDDQLVNRSVNEVRKNRGSDLVVIKETVGNKSRYDGLAKAAEITQTPGILIVYGDKADTWQGFIDADALNSRVSRLTGKSK
ncbi:MAG: hypothetical protein HYX29_05960 [Solirubrobacterales bacterium]|nr:hypothetical protein [Solirubrobacterales bacterium]